MGSAASVDQLPDTCSKEECQTRYGDLFNETEWQKYAVNGTMTRDTLANAFADLTDAFLTHDWGTDGSTHKKVSTINKLLKARGITTWFDEEKMEGNVKKQMIHGIDNARVIVVFVTQRYIDKVGGSNAEDNCQLEFNYAARRKTASKMIPVLIDSTPSLKNPATWTGEVGFVLGGHLYLDLSNAFNDEQLLATRIDELIGKINGIGGVPIGQRFGSVVESKETSRKSSSVNLGPTAAPPMMPTSTVPLASLTKEHVAAMLNALTCSKYSAAFLENDITGEVLMGAAEVNDIKEMGVALSAKARMLFDKITEFKASGVPTSLFSTDATSAADLPSGRPVAVQPGATNEQLAFERRLSEWLPSDWIKLYDYKLEENGKNSASSHILKWPEPPCSLSISSGLFLNGNFKDDAAKDSKLLDLESLGGRMDKADFLLAFKLKVVQGNCTPLSAGRHPWFAIDITSDMCLVVAFNDDGIRHIVRKEGQPLVLPTEQWLDIGIFMCLKRRLVQVAVGTAMMDPIELGSSFAFKINEKYSRDNQLTLARREGYPKMFHGYLRAIELYSSRPASREYLPIPTRDEVVHAKQTAYQHEFVQGMKCLVNFAALNKDVKDIVQGSSLDLPSTGFLHTEHGAYFDGDFRDDVDNKWSVARIAKFEHELKQHHFVFSIEMALLGHGWMLCIGAHNRWFTVCVRYDWTLEIFVNDCAARNICCVNKEPAPLTKGAWTLVSIKMDGNNIDVALNGERMDRIELGDDFAFNGVEGEDGDMRLMNYTYGGCIHGFVKSVAVWSG
ncbi:Aste57867_22543 [Aphanomyces stellatus]|uniref:Aste57867_22543 protein n=1 Tax=Aphanomyces stellatus TaxID=120398 RepID=A0A485LKE0_9STRA|nr:hypothetical protein As57867_022473 [Aphanomyces stellatus]VFT99203.1 Aste57867_22543 [Aphanomyces stellatus]